MNYSYKVIENGREVDRLQTHSKRKFTSHLRTINWKDKPCVYLRVSYGKKIDSFGRLITFYNDGWYKNITDLWRAFNAFIE